MIKQVFLFIALISFSAVAQIGMLDWRIHFSAFDAIGVAQSNEDIYMACANGLIEYDTEDNSVTTITVTNGLSDLGISAIDANDQLVIIGYGNGNLDIIEGNTITNVPWIEMAEIQGEKQINSFYFDDDVIYIASSAGLVLLNNEKKEITDTYYPYDNPVINDVTIYNDSIYVSTASGIYYAYKNQAFLNDKNQWTKLTSIPFYLQSLDYQEIETYNDKLVFSYNSSSYAEDSVYYIQNGQFYKHPDNPKEIHDIKFDDNKLLFATYGGIEQYDDNMQMEFNIWELNSRFPLVEGCLINNGVYWAADNTNGLVKATNTWSNENVFDNTPYTDGSYRLDIQYGNVLVAGGGLTPNQQSNYFRNGVYKFSGEEWTNFNYETQDSISYDFDWDFISVAINPNNTNEMAFASSSAGGLKVVRDGETITEVYDENNSTIERISDRIIITDIQYDNDGNLWLLNQGVAPLKMMSTDGVWREFSLGSAAKNQYPYRLIIDNNGIKWVGVKSVGLIAFDDGGTYDDTSDDQLQTLTATEGYGNLPSAYPKAIAQDIDGEIWIGTETGLVVLYNTSNVFDGDYGEYDASPILIEVDGEVEKLLGETEITSICIDGGNRKWIGTSSSGVFCLSEDGTEEIYRYTEENSPLISNNVSDIQIDLLSGEVYFATEKGLVSVRTDASLSDPDFENVKVFPNPVRPEYSGPITIQGLGYESDVKITDVSGNVVFKTVSNGGTVIWDGKTLQGNRVQSGVYLVWSASSDQKGKNVAKILMIN